MRDGESALLELLKPVEGCLKNPMTTEVVVNRPGEVGVQQSGVWSWLDVPEFTLERLDAIGILAGYMMSRDLSPEHPMLASTLPGGFRIQVCRPPATLPGIISLTIRKPATIARTVADDDFPGLFSNTNLGRSAEHQADRELLRLYANGEWRNFFVLARKSRKTMAATGSMGSGKTDLIKRFLQLTPPETRIVTIEDQPEFGPLGPRNIVNMFYGSSPDMLPEKVLEATLRMMADEIWMQEIRGPESWSLLRALAAGHKGGCTSWHAKEGRELEALQLMVRQHPATSVLSDEVLREHLVSYLDIIVWCDRSVDDGFKVPRVWFRAAEEEREKGVNGEAGRSGKIMKSSSLRMTL